MKNKKIIVLSIISFIIIGILLINPIKMEIYSNQFKNEVKKVLNENYDSIDSIKFSGNYNLQVELKMTSDFNTLSYFDQKPVIKSISKDLKKVSSSYKEKVGNIDSQINNEKGIIKFYVEDFFYNTSFESSTIYKNGNNKEYTDKDYLIEKINAKIATLNLNSKEKENIELYINGIDDLDIYKSILEIEDTDTMLLEIAYQYLLKLSSNHEYSESIFYYKSKLSDYKDSADLLNQINEEEKNRKEIYYSIPRVGMTKEEVLRTSWGKPQNIDHGGTSVDKNNKKRTEGKWDESWYYRRDNRNIFIDFKDGIVVKIITSDGKTGSKEVTSGYGL